MDKLELQWREAVEGERGFQLAPPIGKEYVLQYRTKIITTEKLPFVPYGSTEIVEVISDWADVKIKTPLEHDEQGE